MAGDKEKRIKAVYELDSSGFNKGLKDINTELGHNRSQMQLASAGLKTFGADSERLTNSQKTLTKQVELTSQKMDFYKQAISKTTTTIQENITKRDKLKDSLDSANKKYDETVKMYGKESTEAKKAKDEVNRLSAEHKKAEDAVEGNAKKIQGYENNLTKANTQMVKTQGELKKVSDELDKSNNKWLQSSESLQKSSEKLKDVGGKVSSAGDSILKLTAPMVAGGIASLKFSTDFEDSIAKVSTISEDAEVPIDDLRKGILKLSNDSGIASTEIANNVYDAISAGQKTGDAVNFVTSSTKLAKAGYAEAGQSLDLLTTILNSYGLEATEVTRVSDILINTQNKGKVTVGELSASMGKNLAHCYRNVA